jgi:hypothetical protein
MVRAESWRDYQVYSDPRPNWVYDSYRPARLHVKRAERLIPSLEYMNDCRHAQNYTPEPIEGEA